MMRVLYIDVSSYYLYNWDLSHDAGVVLSKQFGFKYIFVCNSGANISEGDVYAVLLKDEVEELIFMLKNSFELLSAESAERWIFNKAYRNYFKSSPAYIKYLETKEELWQQLQE